MLCLASLIGFSQESVKTWRRRAYQMFTVHDSLTPLAHKEVSKRGKKRKKKRFLITSSWQTNKKLTRNANTSTVALVALTLKLAQILQKKFRSNFIP